MLFVSLEMGQLELAERLLCARSKVDGHKLRTGQNLGTREMTLLGKGYDELRVLADVHRRHPVAEHAPDHRQRAPAEAPPVDRPDRRRLHPAHRQRRVARQPAGADRQDQPPAEDPRPRDEACPSSPSRSSTGPSRTARTAARGWPTSARSGAIEQDADMVLLLHRPEYYDPNDQPGIAELIVAKNRNGATGTVKLTFLKNFTRFENLATVAEPIDEGAF